MNTIEINCYPLMRSIVMKEFNSLKALTKEIKGTKMSQTFEQRIIKKKKISLIYAFNSTGKTRISEEFNKLGAEKVLCFNAFIQDLFTWNNKDRVLKIEANSEIMRQISEQGLENDITNNFRELINNKIDPIFNLENGEISFDIVTGDDKVEQGIKISRGEESIFVWSVFYSVLSTAIFAINDKKEDRTTDEFDKLKYIVIDDPVSSIDDTRIVKIALNLVDLINKYNNVNKSNVEFIITTHHPLFYNILFNSFKKKSYHFTGYLLSKNDNIYELKNQGDTPFSYHLVVKKEIQDAIKNNGIEKHHFNLFRSLLEKTSTFFWYSDWTECLSENNK